MFPSHALRTGEGRNIIRCFLIGCGPCRCSQQKSGQQCLAARCDQSGFGSVALRFAHCVWSCCVGTAMSSFAFVPPVRGRSISQTSTSSVHHADSASLLPLLPFPPSLPPSLLPPHRPATTTDRALKFKVTPVFVCALFWRSAMMMAKHARRGASWWRRHRQLCAWHRHERMTVKMELATAVHHSSANEEVE